MSVHIFERFNFHFCSKNAYWKRGSAFLPGKSENMTNKTTVVCM